MCVCVCVCAGVCVHMRMCMCVEVAEVISNADIHIYMGRHSFRDIYISP